LRQPAAVAVPAVAKLSIAAINAILIEHHLPLVVRWVSNVTEFDPFF
jgi:hypothetical protein